LFAQRTVLGSILLISPLYQAIADTCRANSYGGQDIRNNR
jgi:hypothetical protein